MTEYFVDLGKEYGTDLSSRRRAAELRARVLQAIDNQAIVTIDCSLVRTLSDSFADELFAVLVAEHSPEWFKANIRVVNCAPLVRETLLEAVHLRLERQVARQSGE